MERSAMRAPLALPLLFALASPPVRAEAPPAATPADVALAAASPVSAAAPIPAAPDAAPAAAPAAPVAADPPRSTRPGCVPDLVADAASRWGYGLAEFRGLPTFSARPVGDTDRDREVDDFDMDGERDWLVRGHCPSAGACEEALYLSNFGCARFAVRYAGQLRIRPALGAMVSDVETREPGGCGGKAATITDWSWLDGRYVEVGGVTCGCPGRSAAADAARSPRCPSVESPPTPTTP